MNSDTTSLQGLWQNLHDARYGQPTDRVKKVAKKNVWGNWEDHETHILFDRKTSNAVGSQALNGDIVPLSEDQIAFCRENGWVIDVPSNTSPSQIRIVLPGVTAPSIIPPLILALEEIVNRWNPKLDRRVLKSLMKHRHVQTWIQENATSSVPWIGKLLDDLAHYPLAR